MSTYQTIPTDTTPFFDEVVTLGGTAYLLTFTYSQRENCYYLNIGTPDGDDIVNGIKIVANWPLLHKWADPRLPDGDIFCFANTVVTDPAPGLGQIGIGLAFTMIFVPGDYLPGGDGQPTFTIPK